MSGHSLLSFRPPLGKPHPFHWILASRLFLLSSQCQALFMRLQPRSGATIAVRNRMSSRLHDLFAAIGSLKRVCKFSDPQFHSPHKTYDRVSYEVTAAGDLWSTDWSTWGYYNSGTTGNNLCLPQHESPPRRPQAPSKAKACLRTQRAKRQGLEGQGNCKGKRGCGSGSPITTPAPADTRPFCELPADVTTRPATAQPWHRFL